MLLSDAILTLDLGQIFVRIHFAKLFEQAGYLMPNKQRLVALPIHNEEDTLLTQEFVQ